MYFSDLGNSATGLPLRFGSLSFVVFSSPAPASFFYEPEEGDSGVCPLPPSGVFALFFVVLNGVSFAYSVFGFLSSVPPVYCTCFLLR